MATYESDGHGAGVSGSGGSGQHKTANGPIMGALPDFGSPDTMGAPTNSEYREGNTIMISENQLILDAERAPSMTVDQVDEGGNSDDTDEVSFASSYDDEDDDVSVTNMSAMTGMTGVTAQTVMEQN